MTEMVTMTLTVNREKESDGTDNSPHVLPLHRACLSPVSYLIFKSQKEKIRKGWSAGKMV